MDGLICSMHAAESRSETAAAVEEEDAPTTYRLAYRFERGEVLRYEVKHSANVRTTIDNKTQRVESQSESIKAWKVVDVLPNGEMEFVHVVESVHMMNQTPGGKPNRFDSRSDERPPQGFEQAAAAIGVPLSVIRIAPDGEVVSREEKHPQPTPSPDMPITLQLPGKPLAVGETWDRTYDVTADRKSGGKLKVRTRRVCRLAKVRGKIAEIEVEYQILTPVSAFVESQLVERLTKGTVSFDLARGRIVAQEQNVDARILGFAGKASSMHFLARLQERLVSDAESEKLAQSVSRRGK
jgi:hypothetical protein